MRSILMCTTMLALTATAAPAFAQGAPTADDDSDTIIVTARKREESLVNVPIAVSVATQAQLQRDQINGLTDLPRVTPALELSPTSGGEANGGGRLRGLGTGVFNPSVSSSVAFVVDQVPTGNLAFPQLFDLGQVEVLRGPQGTLFGQGASAGVVNISTRAPKLGKFGSNASLDFSEKGSAGSEVGELIANAGMNVPLGETAALRIATQYKKETGLQRSVTTGKDNKIHDFGIRGRLLFKPSETVTVNLSGEYADETSNGQTFFAIAVAPNSTAPFGPPGGTLGGISTGAFLGCGLPAINQRAEFYCETTPSYLTMKVHGVSAAIDVKLSDQLTLTSVSSYRKRTFNQISRDFSRLAGAPSAAQNNNHEDSKSFNQELRLSYDGDVVDVVAGGYYGNFEFENNPNGSGPYTFGSNQPGQRIGFGVCNPAGTFCPVPTSFTKERTTNRTFAFFADATYKVADQVEIFGGLRYTNYSNTTRVATNTVTAPTTGAGVFVSDDNNVSGRVGLSYKPSSSSNIYASYSKGYKPPAVGTNPAGALFQLRPEKADAFELGAKFDTGGIQLSGNIFYTKIKDFQAQTSVFVGTALVSQPLNVAEVSSKGFELGAMGKVAPGFSINAGYQYNEVKFPTGYVGDDGVSLGGTQFLNAPKHKFTLSGEYEHNLSDNLAVFLNANVVLKSDVLLAARGDPRYRYPGHELINLGLGVRQPDGKWTASIFVRNLTKQREPTAYLASTFAGQADGGIRAWPVAGLTARVIGVKVGFNF